uniref:Uncharacterized protein n=1 Tax=Nothoprocta perdicaria TaxID=30464 RepID=A0A8C6Z435_NOTPE
YAIFVFLFFQLLVVYFCNLFKKGSRSSGEKYDKIILWGDVEEQLRRPLGEFCSSHFHLHGADRELFGSMVTPIDLKAAGAAARPAARRSPRRLRTLQGRDRESSRRGGCPGPSSHHSCPGPSSHRSCPGPSSQHRCPEPSSHRSCPGPSSHRSCLGCPGPSSHRSCPGPSSQHRCLEPSSHRSCPGPSSHRSCPGPSSHREGKWSPSLPSPL